MAARRKGSETSHRNYQWFVEPWGDFAHANWVINQYLEGADVRATRSIRDEDGKPHDVWQCTYREAENLRASQGTVRGAFHIWNRPNNHSPIRLVDFIMPLGKQKKEEEMRRTFKPHPRGKAEPYEQMPLF